MNVALINSKLMRRENLQLAFRALDLDNNGKISISELKTCFPNVGGSKGQAFWESFIEYVDSNHDGSISYDEFEEAMNKLLPNNEG